MKLLFCYVDWSDSGLFLYYLILNSRTRNMGIINKIVVHQYIKILNNSENSFIFLPQILCCVPRSN